MSVKLVWITPNAEETIAFCTRVSNFKNQNNPEFRNLLRYCLKEGHWSPFEMANMCVEIETTRMISAQILRHRSFSFQEFSQRYSKVPQILPVEARRQDLKNRQNSIDDLKPETKEWWQQQCNDLYEHSMQVYSEALHRGVAKECARAILPMSSKTKLYMNGSVRSWIHYLQLRTGNGTQKEHSDIAKKILEIFKREFPVISEVLWSSELMNNDLPNAEIGAGEPVQNP